MRLRRHRVTQENDGIDTADRQSRADLQVAAHRAAEHALDFECGLDMQPSAGGAGRDQMAARQKVGELFREQHHVVFLVVVSDQRDVHGRMLEPACDSVVSSA